MFNSAMKKGFTLIELLVAISIIGIISALLLANFNSARERARDAQRKSDLRNIQTALRLFYNDHNYYPTASADGKIHGCGRVQQGFADCEWGQVWSSDNRVIMTMLPADPLPDQSYSYVYDPNADSYTLTACLENPSDEKGVENTDCPNDIMYQVRP